MICPKTKSATRCLTELFPIYQNKHWIIRRQDDPSVDPSFHRIILKIVGFVVAIPFVDLPISSFHLSYLFKKYSQRWNVIVSKVGTSHTVIAHKLIQSQPRVQIYRGPKKVALLRSSAYCKSAHSRIAPCTHYLNPINDNLTKSFWLPYSRQPLGLSSSRHHGEKLFLKSFFISILGS